METVDFDQLSTKAYKDNSSLKDKDNLWLEVFKLPEWCFIGRKVEDIFEAYISEALSIENESQWIYAFTDPNQATFFAKKHNLILEDGSTPLISVENDENLFPLLLKYQENGVKGIFFNADGKGFYSPISQLTIIKEHLQASYNTKL